MVLRRAPPDHGSSQFAAPPAPTLKELREAVVKRLSEAVKIPTTVGDDHDLIGIDPRWNIFYTFSSFLQKSFPHVYSTLDHEIINEHAHLFIWKGQKQDLKPVLFMAHSDVVPVASSTEHLWTHPPFSGFVDNDFIWGRGSEDDKSNLIAVLSVIEHLIASSWTPTRTIVLSFGFDEEGGADQSYGAQFLAKRILEIYGPNGIEVIVDESFASIESHGGRDYASPAVAEKGYLDVEVRVDCPGGHSSTPPDHTAIGFMAQAIQLIENNPFPHEFSKSNPYMAYLQAVKPPANRPSNQEHQHHHQCGSARALDRSDNDMFRTTTAVTVIEGGDKANSLPESCRVLVNHRIAPHDSVQTVKSHYVELLRPWAKEQGLGLRGFGCDSADSASESHGVVSLSSAYDLEPSPISPIDNACWTRFVKVLHQVFGEETAVAPTLLGGNTDTRYYWECTTNIYRITPFRASHDPRGTRLHTVDERMPIAGMMELVDFYLAFISAFDD